VFEAVPALTSAVERLIPAEHYTEAILKCQSLVSVLITYDGVEISSSHGGEYDVQNCLLGCTAV
jgi:hypothetical protein